MSRLVGGLRSASFEVGGRGSEGRGKARSQKSDVGWLVIYLAACELYIQEILLLLGYTCFFPLNSFM